MRFAQQCGRAHLGGHGRAGQCSAHCAEQATYGVHQPMAVWRWTVCHERYHHWRIRWLQREKRFRRDLTTRTRVEGTVSPILFL